MRHLDTSTRRTAPALKLQSLPVRFDWKVIVREIIDSGMTQQAIADFCGCDQSRISALLKGVTRDPLTSTGLRLLVLHQQRCVKQ